MCMLFDKYRFPFRMCGNVPFRVYTMDEQNVHHLDYSVQKLLSPGLSILIHKIITETLYLGYHLALFAQATEVIHPYLR
jgi:hypothetical protein